MTGLGNCQCLRCVKERAPVGGFPATRMFCCSTCGFKRCPHSDDHRNACSGSNAPGQVGSRYTAMPLPHTELSARELAVFTALGNGRRCNEIARETGLSVKTVSTYRHRALKKTGLLTNAAIAVYCFEHELNGPPAP